MTLVTVAPDTVWLPQHVRERMSVPTEIWFERDAPTRAAKLALHTVSRIREAIEKYERLGDPGHDRTKHWKFISRKPAGAVPPHLVCCDEYQRAGVGAELKLRYDLSPFQGDVDDFMNTDGTATDNGIRAVRDGVVDIVVLLHFLKPALHVRQEEWEEFDPGFARGFIPKALLPPEMRAQGKQEKKAK